MNQVSHTIEPVSVHIIGISGYAKQILVALDEVIDEAGGRLASATVINRSEEEEACHALETRGCRIYENYKAMLADIGTGQNLCIVPTSIYLHAPMTIEALRSGADVLVEKPLAGSLEEAMAIVQAGRMHGRTVLVGYQDMYDPQVREIKQALVNGECGEILSIQLTASWPRGAAYYGRNQWAGRDYCEGMPVFDSPLNNAFAHYINLALYFAAAHRDEIAGIVSVAGRLFRFFPIESFDTANVTFRTDTGVKISALLTHADKEIVEPCIRIEGTGGTLEWRKEERAVLRDSGENIRREWTLDSQEACRRHMLRSAIAQARGDSAGDLVFPASMAIRHVEAVQMVMRRLSIEDGAAALGLKSRVRSGIWPPVSGLLSRLRDAGFPTPE